MLKPAKKGEIRNPKGKPVGTLNRSTIVRRWLEAAGATKGLTKADELVLAALKRGLNGDISAFHALMDSGYGKVADKSESKVEGALDIKISFDK